MGGAFMSQQPLMMTPNQPGAFQYSTFTGVANIDSHQPSQILSPMNGPNFASQHH